MVEMKFWHTMLYFRDASEMVGGYLMDNYGWYRIFRDAKTISGW